MTIYANAGTADITPQAAVPLFGSGLRTGDFQGIADPLEANALVLRQDDQGLVFVSLDLAFVGQELRSSLLSRLQGALADESLFLAASHTHFGPATDSRRPRLGRMSPAYIEQLSDQIGNLVARLLRGVPQPVIIDYVHGEADHAINRRLRTPWHLSRRGLLLGAVVGAPNPAGPRDESVHLLRIRRPDGEPLAAIWSYACHPVSFPRPREISADYPGRVRLRLRHDIGQELPVLFWQGFAGDVRPRELARVTTVRARARRIVLGPRFGRFTSHEWEAWADSLAARVAEIASRPPGKSVGGPVRARRVSRPLAEFVSGASDARTVVFHGIVLADHVAIIGISAEVVTEYGALVRREFSQYLTIPVGYIDEVYGYLPTARMLEEGGYEVSWFLESFELEGPLHPEIERHCLDALRELRSSLGTPSMVHGE